MSLIFNPVVIAGDRVSWDRGIGAAIAAWLRMMCVRVERQFQEITGESIHAGRVLKGEELSRLKARRVALAFLMNSVDDSWDADDWQMAKDWVAQVIRNHNANPTATTPQSDADSNSVSPG